MSASKKNITNWLRKYRRKGKNGVIPGYAWDFIPGRSYDRRALERKYAARKPPRDSSSDRPEA